MMAIRSNYAEVTERFVAGSRRLLDALDEDEYLAVVADVIRSVAARRPVAVRWHGRNVT
jgi:hypothetical protein